MVVAATAALSLGLAAPAGAQTQEGLVNVNVSDVDLGVSAVVQVPIGVAANVCGVNAAVLAVGEQTSDPVCNADATAFNRGQQRAFNIFQ